MESDKQYIELIDLYKRLRRDPDKQEQASLAFNTADKLAREGKVSEETLEASRYL